MPSNIEVPVNSYEAPLTAEEPVIDEQVELKPERPAKPEKITFDEKQQAKVSELIKRAQSAAGREARAEAARLKLELETARRAAPSQEPDTSTLLKLAQAESELSTLKREREETAIKDACRAAVGNDFLNQDLAVRLLRDNIRVIDGKPVVVDESGAPKMGADFEPVSLRDAALALAQEHKYLARGSVRPGAGSTPAESTANPVKLETMFGRDATPEGVGQMHKLARFDRPRYERLRQAARQRGLIR
jgi:hypothetical protein